MRQASLPEQGEEALGCPPLPPLWPELLAQRPAGVAAGPCMLDPVTYSSAKRISVPLTLHKTDTVCAQQLVCARQEARPPPCGHGRDQGALMRVQAVQLWGGQFCKEPPTGSLPSWLCGFGQVICTL